MLFPISIIIRLRTWFTQNNQDKVAQSQLISLMDRIDQLPGYRISERKGAEMDYKGHVEAIFSNGRVQIRLESEEDHRER